MAQDAPSQFQREGHHGFFQFLSPQQRLMMFLDMHKATARMSDDQVRAWRRDQREKVMAMTDADRNAFALKLQSEWDALPPDQKAQARQQMEEYRAQRMKERGTTQGPGMSGPGPSSPGASE